jgi:predicted XRE-type DNA-binding protein
LKRETNKRRTANIFEQLGFPASEAAALEMKSKLHATVVRAAAVYSQAQLQKILHETQPRVSDLMRGKISKFSLETLVDYAHALGLQPEIKTTRPGSALLMKPARVRHALARN